MIATGLGQDDNGNSYMETAKTLLSDTQWINQNTGVYQSKINTAITALRNATGLTEASVIRLPVLFDTVDNNKATAFNGNVVNCLVVGNNIIASTSFGPHFPYDPLNKYVDDTLRAQGFTVKFVDSLDYHVGYGEVHCATHTKRTAPTINWWE